MKVYKEQNIDIIYIDESGFQKEAPRTHGYSEKGQRCFAVHDWQIRQRTNAIGALLNKQLLTVTLFNNTIDADCFCGWIEKDLLPKLTKKSVIVMDNATFHKRKIMIELIENQKHILEYLPPYSPDLNPIEQKWAQVKAIRRRQNCSIAHLFKYNHF